MVVGAGKFLAIPESELTGLESLTHVVEVPEAAVETCRRELW